MAEGRLAIRVKAIDNLTKVPASNRFCHLIKISEAHQKLAT